MPFPPPRPGDGPSDVPGGSSLPSALSPLRVRAEAMLSAGQDGALAQPEELRTLAHDLAVYQVELELQHEEVQATNRRLDAALGQYAQLYHGAPVGFLTLDQNGVILRGNQTFLDMTGVAGVAGLGLASLLEAPAREIFLARYRAIFNAPEGKTLEAQIKVKGGDLMDLRLTTRREAAQPGTAPEGSAPARLLVAVSDISAEKRAERTLQEAQAQILRFNSSLEALVRARTAELALRDAAMRAAANAIAIIDVRGVFQWVNPAFGHLTGHGPEEAPGQPASILNSGRQDRAFFQVLWDTILAGRVWKGELVNRRKDGSEYLESQTITPVPDGQGGISNFIAVKQDVTARKAAEQRLAMLSQVVEQAPSTVVITDLQGRIEYVNPHFTALTGFTPEEVLGRTPRLLKSGLTPPAVFRELWATILAGGVWRGELANRRKSGELFWERIAISPVLDPAGAISHFVAHTEDITRQRLLEENRAHLTAALEQAEDAVTLVSQDGHISFANSAFQRVLGVAGSRLMDKPIRRFLEDPDQPGRLEDLLAQARAGRPWKGRHQVLSAQGVKLTLDATLSPVRNLEGAISSIVVVFRDMTQEIQRGRQLIQAQKMDSLGALAGGVAHDFNNMLSSILLSAELIEWEVEADSPIHDRLELIYQVAGQARDLNSKILSFSRQDEDRRVPFLLDDVVRQAASLLKATLPRNVALGTEGLTPLKVAGDPAQLHQVIMNLAINGSHAIGKGRGRLTLCLGERSLGEGDLLPLPPGTYAELCVRDDGAGMDAQTLEKIFEPFFTTKPAGEGTGLGLSVVQGIVHSHGGHLRVESVPGEGSRFWVLLPLTTADLPAKARRPGRRKAGPGQAEEAPAILVVDDQALSRTLVRTWLTKAGFRVQEARDGQEAWERFRSGQDCHLLLTDLAMPGMDGLELVAKVRRVAPAFPVVILSSREDEDTLRQAQALGVDDFLQKPFDSRALLAALTRLVGAP